MIKRNILTALLIVALCASMALPALALSAEDFSDFPDDWSSEALRAAVDQGLLIGDTHGRLRPGDDLTRAEMAAVVNRAWGCYVGASVQQYADVSDEAWYYDDIRKAVQMGTFVGDTGGTMRPDDSITRAEAIAVVARALQLDLDAAADTSLAKFTDAGDVPAWALPYVRAMVAAGYVQGDGSRLKPNDNITRAEFAQIFYNMISEYITAAGSYTGDRSGNLLLRTSGITLHDMTIDGDLIIGCGATDGEIILSNVTVTGRIVVWGGGTEAVYAQDGTCTETLVVCRVDGPVAVIFDRESTLAVYDTIDVTITPRAAAYPDTRVEFYDLTELRQAQKALNQLVEDNTLSVAMSADLLGLVDATTVDCTLRNNSETDTYVLRIQRADNGQAVCEDITLQPGARLDSIELSEALPFGDYELLTTVTAWRDGTQQGQLELESTLHIAWLWAN